MILEKLKLYQIKFLNGPYWKNKKISAQVSKIKVHLILQHSSDICNGS